MRLCVLFLAVLALSAIVTSMAAWGITYGTSYSRVTTMAAHFTGLAQGSFAGFRSFVTDLLGGNTALVDAILLVQKTSGVQRTEQTKAQMLQTIGMLVNYTTNSTDQTQQQMDEVVDAFGDLMGTVVAEFKGLASQYMAQVRADLTAKGSSTVSATGTAATAAMQRFQSLYNVGLLDLARQPTDPVGEPDCTLLGVLCDTATDFLVVPFTVTSATGRYYSCGNSDGAAVTMANVSGGTYSEYQLSWPPYASSVNASGRKSMKQRCLTDTPIVTVLITNCPLPRSCQCGKDQRCNAWYRPHINATTTRYIAAIYPTPTVKLHSTMTLLNLSTSPPSLIGVVDYTATLAQTQYLLPTLSGLSSQTYLANLLNDTTLTVLGSKVRKCAANASQPGDPSLPTYSAFRSCDPGLRQVAQWLAGNPSLSQPLTLEIDGMLWDLSPIRTTSASYFFIVGTNKSEVYRAIDLSEVMATNQLIAVRGNLTRQVAAAGSATRTYVADRGAQNLLAAQAMQDSFLAELGVLENASRVSLAKSQAQSAANAQLMMAAQTVAVETEKTTELNAMGITAGWTIAVVSSLLLVVLCLSAFGTIRVTNNLIHIIRLMEDVADMKVESLAIPQGSSVQEVARIQSAFKVMVYRLAEYKSYIPAGVFEKLAQEGRDGGASEDGHVSDRYSMSELESAPQSCKMSHDGKTSTRVSSLSDSNGHKGALPPMAGRRSTTKQVAVLSVNVVGFMDLLLTSNEALSKTVFNEYVTYVHEAVSQGRGNVDFLSGDQVFVTFNAHVPCGDPAGAAVAAALDLRQLLLRKLGGRLKFHIGLSFGPVFATTVGYAKFKFMATVGSPMKISAILSHMERLENGATPVDANLQERMKYLYNFQPVEFLHLPWLKSFAREVSLSQRVFLLENKKKLQEDEWLYQVEEGTDTCDWTKAFEQLVAATTAKEMEDILDQYMTRNPLDDMALRLWDRMSLWVPGKGIRV
eukprot:EG_transcript_855